jgi:small subunit ribosomal protein S6
MKNYELLYILNPNLSDEEIDKNVEDVQKAIVTKKGEVAEIDKWGRRDLATIYKKQKVGYYVLVTFQGDNKVLAKLNGFLRISEPVLRFLIVNLDEKTKEVAVEK